MEIITSIKSVGGSKVIVLPKEIKDYIGNDVLVKVNFKKYISTRQEQFNKYQESHTEISISFNNTIITGEVVRSDAEKLRIKQGDETFIIYYKDIDNVDIPKQEDKLGELK